MHSHTTFKNDTPKSRSFAFSSYCVCSTKLVKMTPACENAQCIIMVSLVMSTSISSRLVCCTCCCLRKHLSSLRFLFLVYRVEKDDGILWNVMALSLVVLSVCHSLNDRQSSVVVVDREEGVDTATLRMLVDCKWLAIRRKWRHSFLLLLLWICLLCNIMCMWTSFFIVYG